MKKIFIAIVLTALTVSVTACGLGGAGKSAGASLSYSENKAIPAFTPQPTATAHEQTVQEIAATPTEELPDVFAGKVKFPQIMLYEGLEAEEIPVEINVYDTQPLLIDGLTGASFEENLAEKGWKEHEFEATDIPGLYFIGSKKRGDLFDNNEDFDAAAEDFIKDSGLLDYAKALGMGAEGELQGEGGKCTKYYWLTVDGCKTNSYIRINLESDSICGECKIYLCENTVIGTLPSVSLESALENAFCLEDGIVRDLGKYDFNINKAKLQYINGLPYYEFLAYATGYRLAMEGYAPAVSIDEIMADDALLEKFINFGG